MPGPGFDLIGDEELAEVAAVINSGRLSRYGPDDETFPAKVQHRSMSFGIGVVDSHLSPFGLRRRDNTEIARRRADRFISAYRAHAA